MRELLPQLKDLNTTCRIHLAKLLSSRHHVGMAVAQGEMSGVCSRGGAGFLAFDPWNTCWTPPEGSYRFFDAAEKKGFLQPQEAALLSKALVRYGAEVAPVYDGRFSSFFRDPRVKAIFEHADELDNLSESGLAIGASWADRLFEACPWPLLPEKHLGILSFRDIDSEISSPQTPWLAWIWALDMICVGPWVGFQAHEIVEALTAFPEAEALAALREGAAIRPLENRTLGQRVVIPLFSHGLQGIVIGFFCGIPKSQKEPIISTLFQFGQTMADAYSALRVKRFTQALHSNLTLEALAREVISVTSPVSKVITLRNGKKFGYKLVYEHNYWGGYDPIPAHELENSVSTCGFTVDLPNDASIYIEPLTDVPNFDRDFAKMRLESCLADALDARIASEIHSPLSLRDVRKLHEDLHAYTADGNASVAKLRQYYIVRCVEENWLLGCAKINNAHLKAFLERMTGRKITNGYQASSFLPEVERMFENRISVEKTRKGLSLSWNGDGTGSRKSRMP